VLHRIVAAVRLASRGDLRGLFARVRRVLRLG
jgi:hypothetical protein